MLPEPKERNYGNHRCMSSSYLRQFNKDLMPQRDNSGRRWIEIRSMQNVGKKKNGFLNLAIVQEDLVYMSDRWPFFGL